MGNQTEEMMIGLIKKLGDAAADDTQSTKKLATIMVGLKDTNWDTVTKFELGWKTITDSDGSINAIVPTIKLEKEPSR